MNPPESTAVALHAHTDFLCTNHSVNSRQRPSESNCITKQLS